MRWEDDDSTPTWEPLEEIGRRFPDIHLVGKAVPNSGGVDTGPPLTPPVQEDNAREEQEAEPEVALEPTPAISEQEKRESATTRTLRPCDKLKPPSKFQN